MGPVLRTPGLGCACGSNRVHAYVWFGGGGLRALGEGGDPGPAGPYIRMAVVEGASPIGTQRSSLGTASVPAQALAEACSDSSGQDEQEEPTGEEAQEALRRGRLHTIEQEIQAVRSVLQDQDDVAMQARGRAARFVSATSKQSC